MSTILPGVDASLSNPESPTVKFLQGAKLGVLTNHTGITSERRSTLDALLSLNLNVVALFSPEHGFAGTREGVVESGTFQELPIHSLYGETRRPTREALAEIDILICDLQDVGARFYTYSTTLAYCLEECAKYSVAVVVLDRPNPIGGQVIEGPLCDAAHRSFVGYLDIPVRHGMTMGELALLHKADQALDVELHIARVLGWRRELLWPQPGLHWPVPSPNLPDAASAFWYPGVCLLEFSGVSVGRGTEAPFQIVGAPWMEPARVLDAVAKWPVEVQNSLHARSIEFTPTRGECEGELCHGLRFTHSSSAGVPSPAVPLGLCLLSALHETHPEFNENKLRAALPLLGSERVFDLLLREELEAAIEVCNRDAETFRARRAPFLLYD